jgi:primase-polymerase (primpol)-like protein
LGESVRHLPTERSWVEYRPLDPDWLIVWKESRREGTIFMSRTKAEILRDSSSEPPTLTVIPENIPAELKAYDHWVNWNWDWKKDKWDKPPVDSWSGIAYAKSSDPKTWGTFDRAISTLQQCGLAGIGFVVHKGDEHADPFVVFDLDECRNPECGATEPWAQQIIDELASYTEVSPSGTGIRIVAKGEMMIRGAKAGKFEVYQTGRYVTITGHHLAGTPQTIEDRQEAIEAICARELRKEPQLRKESPPPVDTDGEESESYGHLLTDDDVFEYLRTAANSTKTAALLDGEWEEFYPSQSEADMALCSCLIFYVGYDSDRINELFRQTGLMRPKWNRSCGFETYGDRTVRKAIEFHEANVREFWSPFKPQSEQMGPFGEEWTGQYLSGNFWSTFNV